MVWLMLKEFAKLFRPKPEAERKPPKIQKVPPHGLKSHGIKTTEEFDVLS